MGGSRGGSRGGVCQTPKFGGWLRACLNIVSHRKPQVRLFPALHVETINLNCTYGKCGNKTRVDFINCEWEKPPETIQERHSFKEIR